MPADPVEESICDMKSKTTKGDNALKSKEYTEALRIYSETLKLAENVDQSITALAKKLQQRAKKMKQKFDLDAEIQKMKADHSFQLCREQAILHCRMAIAYKKFGNTSKADHHAEKSVEHDETYFEVSFCFSPQNQTFNL